MQIRIREASDINIVDIEGPIDINASEIIETVGWLIKSRKKNILLNFDKVDTVDYSGISILAIAYKNVMNHNGKMKFCNVTLHIEELFKLVRLDSIFEIYTNEETALKTFHFESTVDKRQLRRRFKRLDVHIEAEFRLKEKTKAVKDIWYKGKIPNLSGEGLFLYAKKVLPLGKRVELKINLGEKLPLAIDGIVIWIADKALQPQSYPGMGIQFQKIRKQYQDRLLVFIGKHLTRRSAT